MPPGQQRSGDAAPSAPAAVLIAAWPERSSSRPRVLEDEVVLLGARTHADQFAAVIALRYCVAVARVPLPWHA